MPTLLKNTCPSTRYYAPGYFQCPKGIPFLLDQGCDQLSTFINIKLDQGYIIVISIDLHPTNLFSTLFVGSKMVWCRVFRVFRHANVGIRTKGGHREDGFDDHGAGAHLRQLGSFWPKVKFGQRFFFFNFMWNIVKLKNNFNLKKNTFHKFDTVFWLLTQRVRKTKTKFGPRATTRHHLWHHGGWSPKPGSSTGLCWFFVGLFYQQK